MSKESTSAVGAVPDEAGASGNPTYFFAYGSLLSSPFLLRHIPSAKFVTRADLANFEVEFLIYSEVRQGGSSCIREAPGKMVRGVIYAIAEEEMHDLDLLEGVPEGRYKREAYSVLAEDGKWYEADLYRVVNPTGPYVPAKSYLDDMIEGAQEHGLDAEYTENLISWRRSLD